MKNPPEFYAARDAVEHNHLLKCSIHKLKKHLSSLQVHQPWESDPLAADAKLRKGDWILKLEKEIEKRKLARKYTIKSIFIKVAAGLIVAGIIIAIITFFINNFWLI